MCICACIVSLKRFHAGRKRCPAAVAAVVAVTTVYWYKVASSS